MEDSHEINRHFFELDTNNKSVEIRQENVRC